MSKNIDFCIPYISSGIKALEYLISNLIITTTKLDRLRIIVSYHNNDELKILETSAIFKYIHKTIHAPIVEDKTILSKPSYNHSVALKCLIKNIESEIVIISDYDVAILKYGWDEIIEHNLDNNYDIIGVCYPNYNFTFKSISASDTKIISFPSNLTFSKYQSLPNLVFFCTKNVTIKNSFNNRLTNFDEFLLDGNLPFRIINSKKLESENNLPLGSFQWLDTGYEIPEVISNSKLSYMTLIYDFNQKILPIDMNEDSINHPEIYLFPRTNVPFLVHFKKASKRLEKNNLQFEKNFDIISKFLKNTK
jgi:hypothetical protein